MTDHKPIVVFKIPFQYLKGNQNSLSGIESNMADKLPDYNVIVVPSQETEISMQVFYDKDFKQETLDAIKNLILEEMNK